MTEPEFLSVEDVRWLHERQLELYGGLDGVRDGGLLDSAVAMPQQSFGRAYLHNDLFAMAAAYAFHLAENQPFVDGNKRTALEACLVFLDLNGIVVLDPARRLFEAMVALSARTLTKDGFAELLRALPRAGAEEP